MHFNKSRRVYFKDNLTEKQILISRRKLSTETINYIISGYAELGLSIKLLNKLSRVHNPEVNGLKNHRLQSISLLD